MCKLILLCIPSISLPTEPLDEYCRACGFQSDKGKADSWVHNIQISLLASIIVSNR